MTLMYMKEHVCHILAQVLSKVLMKISIMIYALTLFYPSLLYATDSTTLTRWLWVPGTQVGTGCEAEIHEVYQSFIKRITELMPIEVILDDAISCRDERCLSARVIAAGAKVGILANTTCTEHMLSIDLMNLPLDQPAQHYQEGMNRSHLSATPKKIQTRSTRGGAPLSPHLTMTQRIGMKLAHSMTLGPVPKVELQPESPFKTGFWLSMNHEMATLPGLLGGGFHFELAHAPRAQSVVWYGTVGYERIQSALFTQRKIIGNFGGRRRLSQHPFSPILGGNLELSYGYSKQRIDEQIFSLSTNQEQVISLERTYLKNDQGIECKPSVEAGLSWRGSTLELLLSTRISPLMISPLAWRGSWSTLLGVRW